MAEAQPSKRERQPISIPFIWEEKPGMPKKDWKPPSRPVEPPAPPVKFVVSVPFGWEEKPGTPFPAFITYPPKEDESLPPTHSITNTNNNDESSESEPSVPPGKSFERKEKPGTPLPGFVQPWKDEESPPPPKHTMNDDESSVLVLEPDDVPRPGKFIVSVPFGWEEKPGTPLPGLVQPAAPKVESQLVVYSHKRHTTFLSPPSKYSTDDDQGGDNEGDDESSEWEVESDESFISAKSLLANGLISTATISNAVPVQQQYNSHNSLALVTTEMHSTLLQQCPGSPASETDDSCAAGTTSLAGASFLEWLFPLLVPNSNVVSNKVVAYDRRGDIESKEYELHGSNCSTAEGGRPLLTLGDLIAMSRRRSCQRRVNKIHNLNQPSMEFLKRNAFGCCIFETGRNEINRLSLKWKRQLQLKLIGNEINRLSLKWKRQLHLKLMASN